MEEKKQGKSSERHGAAGLRKAGLDYQLVTTVSETQSALSSILIGYRFARVK